VTADCNGWNDLPEDERESLDQYDRRCGALLVSAHDHVLQSLARIERTNRKWKEIAA
jgi:hypothetical protein